MWYQLLTMIIINISSRNRSRNSSSRSKSRSKFDKFRYACVIIHTHTHKTPIRIYRNVDMQASNVKKFPFQPFGCDGSQLTNYRNCTHLHTLHMCLCMSIARNVRLSLCVYLFHSLIWFCVLETDVWRRCSSPVFTTKLACSHRIHRGTVRLLPPMPQETWNHFRDQTENYTNTHRADNGIRFVQLPMVFGAYCGIAHRVYEYCALLSLAHSVIVSVFVCVYRYSNHYYYYCYYEPDYYCW